MMMIINPIIVQEYTDNPIIIPTSSSSSPPIISLMDDTNSVKIPSKYKIIKRKNYKRIDKHCRDVCLYLKKLISNDLYLKCNQACLLTHCKDCGITAAAAAAADKSP